MRHTLQRFDGHRSHTHGKSFASRNKKAQAFYEADEKRLQRKYVKKIHKTKGQGLVEYALILVLIAVIVIGILSLASDMKTKCAPGYIYVPSVSACLQGYKPGEQGR